MASNLGWLDARPCLIGVVHLGALPGAPRHAGGMEAILARAARDAEAYARAGFDAVLVENYGDAPFHPRRVPAETIAALAVAAREVRRAVKIPVGVNCLRNDGLAAVAVAAAAGLDFFRVNVFVGAAVGDQGLLEGEAHDVVRARARLAPNVKIFADVHVKHAVPLGGRPIGEEALDAVRRGLADAVVVSGGRTGAPPSAADAGAVVKALAGAAPVFAGSGLDTSNARDLLALVDGAIVGTSVKVGGLTEAAVDGRRARALVKVGRRQGRGSRL